MCGQAEAALDVESLVAEGPGGRDLGAGEVHGSDPDLTRSVPGPAACRRRGRCFKKEVFPCHTPRRSSPSAQRLLLGNIANTDAQMLSQSLSTLGINVFWHTVVGDNPQRLQEALDIARRRADIILTTGGLGPTYDDLTKQTICAAFGKKLVLHEDILEDIRAFYAVRPPCAHAGKQHPAGRAAGGLHRVRQSGGHRPRLRL